VSAVPREVTIVVSARTSCMTRGAPVVRGGLQLARPGSSMASVMTSCYADSSGVPVQPRSPALGTTATRPSRTMSTSSPRDPMSSFR